MWRFHPMFWFVALFALLFVSRRRRWARRWAPNGPADYPPNGWGFHQHMQNAGWGAPPQPAVPRPLTEPDAALVESLESRIAGLEQRLEFAERMLAERGTTPPRP